MPSTHLLRIVIPFALGYFASYLFRSVNAVLGPKLTADLGLNAADLGFLTSTYFLSFAAMQIPLGIWLDKYQPHKIEATLMTIAAAGAFIFAISENLIGVAFGRLLIGVGVSACLMAAFRAFTQWFDPQELTKMNGIQLASGGLGALFATEPTAFLADAFGWRAVFMLLGVFTLIIAIILWRIVPHSKVKPSSNNEITIGFKEIFLSRSFIAIAPVASIIQASYISLLGLWAHPWLQYVTGVGEHAATTILFWSTAAMTIGFVSWGHLSTLLESKGIQPVTTAFGGMALYILTFTFVIVMPNFAPTLLWMLLAFFGVSSPIIYAVLARHFPRSVSGRVITALNLVSFIFSFVIQWGLGVIINIFPKAETGAYVPQAYVIAFSSLLAITVLIFISYFVLRRNIQFTKDSS